MDRMREHSPIIVSEVCTYVAAFTRILTYVSPSQAAIVSRELIRVAILWHELWHEGLEEASRLYFSDKNPEAMIACLAPLHDMIEKVGCPSKRTQFITDETNLGPGDHS